MIVNIWKLSKAGWRLFLNGTGEQQLIAGIAIGAIVGLERAIIVIRKSREETKELEKNYQRLKKETDKLVKIAEEDISEMKRIEKILENLED